MAKNNEIDDISREQEEVREELLSIVSALDDKEEVRALIDDLLTDKEKVDIINRFLIMRDIYQGKSQRDIAQRRNMSLCRITRGSKMLKKPSGYIKKLLNEKYDDHTHL